MKEPRIKNKNLEGDIVSDKKYSKQASPRASRNYVPRISFRTGKMLVDLDQKELDKLVLDIGFYSEEGNLITNAPMNNPDAPFWKHPDVKVRLMGSGTSFNDDEPLDKFWLNCFRADPKFKVSGQKLAPSVAATVDYTVTAIQDGVSASTEATDELYKAMKLLTLNEDNFDKLTSILRAMGTDTRKASPKLVKNALMRKITDQKDHYLSGTGERNIDAFIRLCGVTTQELKFQEMVTQSLTKGVIVKRKNNKYYYGDIELGTSKAKIENYLEDPENNEIMVEIREKLKK